MSEPKIRDLRATDIRCAVCNAATGETCAGLPGVHAERQREVESLRAVGWQWQEVDPRDVGALGSK